MAGATGLEPATFGVTGRHSNQLSYAPAAVPPNLTLAGRREEGRCTGVPQPCQVELARLTQTRLGPAIRGPLWRRTTAAARLSVFASFRHSGIARPGAGALQLLEIKLGVMVDVELVEQRIGYGGKFGVV